MPPSLDDLFARALHEPGPVVFLTGAGVSAQSGIPTFRGPEGYWTVGSKHYQPEELATQAAFRAMPREVWRWYLYRLGVCRRAQPNAGHHALVELERALGERFRLVTQNVDGLHHRAGQTPERTYCIHGRIELMRCSVGCCTELFPIPDAVTCLDRETPLTDDGFERLRCPRCGAMSRPHVLWFDEYYDEELFSFETVLGLAERASLLVTVGTSGATNLPMQLAMGVARAGKPVVDINPEDNPFASLARRTGGAAVRQNAADALQALARCCSPRLPGLP